MRESAEEQPIDATSESAQQARLRTSAIDHRGTACHPTDPLDHSQDVPVGCRLGLADCPDRLISHHDASDRADAAGHREGGVELPDALRDRQGGGAVVGLPDTQNRGQAVAEGRCHLRSHHILTLAEAAAPLSVPAT